MFHRTVWRPTVAVFFLAVFRIGTFLLPVRGEVCSVMIKASAGEDLTTLRDKTFAAFRKECRLNKNQLNETFSCAFSTEAADPHTFQFILKPLSVPFRLDFAVKTKQGAVLALAENATHGSIFAEISIGGAINSRSVIRPCYYRDCSDRADRYDEAGVVNATEYRPFWIDYNGGVVRVGKGGQEEAFLEWDAGAHHKRVATQVRIGIASWTHADGEWVFYRFCK